MPAYGGTVRLREQPARDVFAEANSCRLVGSLPPILIGGSLALLRIHNSNIPLAIFGPETAPSSVL